MDLLNLRSWSFYFVFPLVLLSFVGCKESEYNTVPAADIDQRVLSKAALLSQNILNKQKAGSYYAFSKKDATQAMISGLDEDKQKSAYENIRSALGDFRTLSFHEALTMKDGTAYTIYRFKGTFGEDRIGEIRAVLDAQEKLAGFFVKPWKDKL